MTDAGVMTEVPVMEGTRIGAGPQVSVDMSGGIIKREVEWIDGLLNDPGSVSGVANESRLGSVVRSQRAEGRTAWATEHVGLPELSNLPEPMQMFVNQRRRQEELQSQVNEWPNAVRYANWFDEQVRNEVMNGNDERARVRMQAIGREVEERGIIAEDIPVFAANARKARAELENFEKDGLIVKPEMKATYDRWELMARNRQVQEGRLAEMLVREQEMLLSDTGSNLEEKKAWAYRWQAQLEVVGELAEQSSRLGRKFIGVASEIVRGNAENVDGVLADYLKGEDERRVGEKVEVPSADSLSSEQVEVAYNALLVDISEVRDELILSGLDVPDDFDAQLKQTLGIEVTDEDGAEKWEVAESSPVMAMALYQQMEESLVTALEVDYKSLSEGEMGIVEEMMLKEHALIEAQAARQTAYSVAIEEGVMAMGEAAFEAAKDEGDFEQMKLLGEWLGSRGKQIEARAKVVGEFLNDKWGVFRDWVGNIDKKELAKKAGLGIGITALVAMVLALAVGYTIAQAAMGGVMGGGR